jgi:hypothetical protein
MKITAIAVSLPQLRSRSCLTERLADFVSLMKPRVISRCHPHSHVVLGRQHVAAVGARHPARPCGACHRPDGRSSGLLPAHHYRTGQYQQRAGLAFGVLIVTIVVAGSVWIMSNLERHMMPPAELMNLRMQH